MKKKALLLVIVIGVFCLAGCKRIELDEKTEEAYIEYAVNAVINHDKNNMLKLERVEIEKEEETHWISDGETGNNGDSDKPVDTPIEDELTYVSFEKALGTDKLSVKVKGIKECNSYPENTGDDLTFAMTASTGSRLVVVELELNNISGDSVSLATENYSFKGIFNGVVKTNALFAFDYGLNGNTHIIEPGKTKSAVLVYELNSERVKEINKLVISVSRDSETYNVSVK